MDKRKIILTVFFLVIVLTGFVSAADTVINIRTVSVHRAVVTILGAGEGYTFLDSFFEDTGDKGELSVTYSGTQEEIKVNVLISKEGDKVMLEKFGPFPAGEPIYLQVIPGKVSDNYKAMDEEKAAEEAAAEEAAAEPEPEVVADEEPAEPEVVADEEPEEEKKGITGSAIFSKKIEIPKTVYYVVGGILLVGVLLIVVMKLGPSIKRSIPKVVPKLGSSSSSNAESVDVKISDAQNRIKEAQSEIAKLQNQGEIKAAELKLEQDKKRLEALKKGILDDKAKLDKWEDSN